MYRHIKHSITINATPADVWRALTDKDLIREYMFGTETTCDWQKGSKLSYTGEYEGHKYNDGGEILEAEPERLLKHTYWSSMSGVEDIPENYALVTYTITPGNGGTILTAEQ
ncbi:MAG: SRPBCC domain-containing protein [Chitinophagales bacterium]|nr:SRPBCC domain-containing protein [Chitinophagales bacterium]